MPKSPHSKDRRDRRDRKRVSKIKCFSGVLEAHRPVLLGILKHIIPQFDELSEVQKEWLMDTCEKIKLSTHCDPPSGEETDLEERDRCYIETFVDKCKEDLDRLEEAKQQETDFYKDLVDLENYFFDRKNLWVSNAYNTVKEGASNIWNKYVKPVVGAIPIVGSDEDSDEDDEPNGERLKRL